MPEIVKLFHGSKIVHDVLQVGGWYHDFFGSWVYEAQTLPHEDSWNSANLMGGTFSMEMLSPKDPEGDKPAARFLKRHGNHFINIAFWVRDCPALAQQLLDKGVRIALPGGVQVKELPKEPFTFFVPHPKDAFGTLFEFIEENPDFHDPRRAAWWSPAYWRDQHPLGNEGLSHATVAVADLDGAAGFYRDVLGCPMVHEEMNESQGTRSLFFAVADILVELASPVSEDSPIGRHMEVHGPIVYSFTFKVKDVARAAEHTRSKGLTVHRRGDHTIELDPAQAQGGVFGFTDRVLPGHPTFA